jgi:hypothetical protein
VRIIMFIEIQAAEAVFEEFVFVLEKFTPQK